MNCTQTFLKCIFTDKKMTLFGSIDLFFFSESDDLKNVI